MIRPWTRNKTLLLVIIILSLVAIYFVSSVSIITPLRTELKTVESELKVYEVQVDKISGDSEKPGDDDTDLNDVLLKIPQSKSTDDVLSTIHQIAKEAKLSVNSMSSIGSVDEVVASDEDAEDVQSTLSTNYAYSLEITATKLIDMNRFLDKLLIQDRLLTIESLNLKQNEENITASIVFSAYHTNN